jgi:hypothetical protein
LARPRTTYPDRVQRISAPAHDIRTEGVAIDRRDANAMDTGIYMYTGKSQ